MGDTMKFLKRTITILLVLIVAFSFCVIYINRNSKHMTPRQKILKAIYPVWMWFTGATGTNNKAFSNEKAAPAVSFYSLKAILNNGAEFDFAQLKGKKVLLVNTASDCGYTSQYDDLQELYEQYNGRLVILGFPANDFKEQEKGSDKEIAEFCKINYGVNFPLMKKSSVVKGAGQNPVFKWLTDSTNNGWNNKPPAWNFSKYLVDENGILTNYFGSSVSPMSAEIINALK
jgi:glutathione peroxidase